MNVFHYIQNEMTSPDGDFFAAQDADSDGIEGLYYLFTQDEIYGCLGPEDGVYFCRKYGVTKKGNFEGKNILHLLNGGLPDQTCGPMIKKLYEYRKNRMDLHKDDKILTAWNGLMIACLASASMLLDEPVLFHAAERAIHSIEQKSFAGKKVLTSRRSMDGPHSKQDDPSGQGFLDDYAFLILANVEMYRAAPASPVLSKALDL
jgi:hypothetical protein